MPATFTTTTLPQPPADHVRPPHFIEHKTDPRIVFPRPVSAFTPQAAWLTHAAPHPQAS